MTDKKKAPVKAKKPVNKTKNKPSRGKSGKGKEPEAIQTKSPKKKALPKKRKSEAVPRKKSKGGRPTRYKPEFVKQAKFLCKWGAIDKDLAEFFGVKEQTINNWKKAHPEFFESLKQGKPSANQMVEKSLFNRAIGYSHPDLHISVHQGKVKKTKITKHYPPETTAAIFFLKNRDPANWKDTQEVEHSGAITIKTDSDDEEL